MALSRTILQRTVWGNERIIHGTLAFTAGSSSGTLNSGLKQIKGFHWDLRDTGTAGTLISSYVNATIGSFTAGTLPTGNVFLTAGTRCQEWYWTAIGV